MKKGTDEPESYILTGWLFFRLMGVIHLSDALDHRPGGLNYFVTTN
jgi:hypothetical protein